MAFRIYKGDNTRLKSACFLLHTPFIFMVGGLVGVSQDTPFSFVDGTPILQVPLPPYLAFSVVDFNLTTKETTYVKPSPSRQIL
ncbi:hypothetical protein [Moraxella bovis]|uniref:hypothetical protein n=1 Tax=Moraxella bovis TaxID=476 RepID=UPI00227A5FA3|nr:hypothetical protein [Moraxella bovis]WAJ74577.1 hypothetical protein LP095_05345 [Moraxella bovis]WAJ74830.1 hypothetical protein LP095_06705 [Moraxella bovis]